MANKPKTFNQLMRGRAKTFNEATRGTPAERGYDHRWTKFRARYLRKHPLCVACKAEGRTEAATDVDHITPMADGGARFDQDNLQALCHSCHSRKTRRDMARRGRGDQSL